jgi:hypothetical protein
MTVLSGTGNKVSGSSVEVVSSGRMPGDGKGGG